jgi:hypothetical protein
LADFLNAPKIKEVDVNKYTGSAGSTIRIRVIDDFMVKSVNAAVYSSDGGLAEQGAAVILANGVDWLYTATTSNANLAGSKIVIRASDLPGNTTDSNVNL